METTMSNPTTAVANSYDELPYTSNPFPQTHPDHLATLATLFGLTPPPLDNCRILELGCAAGGNIIPMAVALSGSHCVGIDYSGKQIADGQKTLTALGIKNVELKHLSILDVTKDLGEFDYILCHGVYSWVPEAVQDKILQIYSENLSRDGVGYLSYNTFPGWHMRGQIRDMMGYHDAHHRDKPPLERVGQARALLDFLAKSVQGDKNPYSLLLRQELETLQKHNDSYLFHEHLEEHNDPIYFFEFYERITAKKLRYIGEADFRSMVPMNFPPDVQEVLNRLGPNLIQMEQYLDFLRNRTFRQSLLGHEHVRPNYNLHPALMEKFNLASPLKPAAEKPALATMDPVEFKGPNDISLTSGDPIVKAALVHLASVWPRSVPFATLRAEARKLIGSAKPEDPAELETDNLLLGKALLTGYATAGGSIVELSLMTSPFVTTVADRPKASPLARVQAASGHQVTNLAHQPVGLTEFDRQLLPYLDGAHNRSSLLKIMVERYKQGFLTVAQEGKPVTEEHRARPILAQTLDLQLPRLAKAALLVA
jgi:methyltransferase-like protein/cyclopropane fatty-acyl-phospholipid synthase-like methyltransferase